MAESRSQRLGPQVHASGVYLEVLCFHLQQAAEQSIEAILIHHRVAFPYVHDLARLLTVLAEVGEPIPESLREAEVLAGFAVIVRYPGIAGSITLEQYSQAVHIATATVRWAEGRLQQSEL
jgi:HEPN domain-containing protein